MKIPYCRKCKNIRICGSKINKTHRCAAGETKKDYLGDTLYYTLCSEKNENLDCKDFKLKIF